MGSHSTAARVGGKPAAQESAGKSYVRALNRIAQSHPN